MDRLFQIGFREVGQWSVEAGRLRLQLQHLPPHRRALYAFVVDAKVLYVGKTAGSLDGRLQAYVAPHATQRTNVRNRAGLLELLGGGHAIRILGWIDPALHRIGPFDLNMAAGLEDSIIAMLAPPWNGARSTVAVKDYLAASGAVAVEYSSPSVVPPRELAATADAADPTTIAPVHQTASATSGSARASVEPSIDATFTVRLGKTYYQRGFFNVPVDFSSLFGTHGSYMDLYCGQERLHLRATLDRNANQQSSTPRIYGRAELANWFQRQFQLDSTLRVTVLSSTSAVLI